MGRLSAPCFYPRSHFRFGFFKVFTAVTVGVALLIDGRFDTNELFANTT